MDDEACYKTWNCGQGVLLIADTEHESHILRTATEYGINAKVCGEITKTEKPIVRIKSQFTGKWIPPFKSE